MNTAGKLAAFAAVLAVGFGGAAAVGAAVGPFDVGGDTVHSTHSTNEAAVGDLPAGLAVSQSGYRLVVDTPTVVADAAGPFGFSILDDSGAPVTLFDQRDERPMDLIVLSRDLVDYRHLHPVMDATGHWTAELPALPAGSYRFFADFQPNGAAHLTLGTDITVPDTHEEGH